MTQQHPTTAMSELSPVAQAVLDAYWKSPSDPSLQHKDRYAIAAALEAAADQVVPKEELIMNARGTRDWHRAIQRAETRAVFFAIAAELKAYA